MGIQEFYSGQDAFTDPGEFAGLYNDLPKSPADLRDIVSQLIIHVAWAARYDIPPNLPMSRETQAVSERLKLSMSLCPESLCKNRLPDQRSFGTCRDYSIMLCSMLRYHSIPARIRCGFANYFTTCPFEDHWICEFWSPQDGRWVGADAQLDQVHREQLSIGFDAADLPGAVFLTAGQAWRLARSGGAESEAFGHGDARGLSFIHVNVYRDLLALTNQCISAWDTWRSATSTSKVLGGANLATVDSLAGVIGDFEAGANRLGLLHDIASRSQRPPWQD
jgi:Transglutaminase-like superfamily